MITVSPDDFWLLIAQGVAQHVGGDNATAEKYRNTFVNHQGKKKLEIDGKLYGIHPKSANNKDGWPQAMQEFVRQIKANTKTNISDIMYASFSTSGQEVQTAFAGALMETMKNYFEYRMQLLCGIPKVYLLGLASEYQEIIDRVDQLRSILPDFQWYLDRVRSRMETIAESANGNENNSFWNRMIMEEARGSGGQKYMTGWLPDFIPYVYARVCRMIRNFPKPMHTRFSTLKVKL